MKYSCTSSAVFTFRILIVYKDHGFFFLLIYVYIFSVYNFLHIFTYMMMVTSFQFLPDFTRKYENLSGHYEVSDITSGWLISLMKEGICNLAFLLISFQGWTFNWWIINIHYSTIFFVIFWLSVLIIQQTVALFSWCLYFICSIITKYKGSLMWFSEMSVPVTEGVFL